jgi:hypothetical protein
MVDPALVNLIALCVVAVGWKIVQGDMIKEIYRLETERDTLITRIAVLKQA